MSDKTAQRDVVKRILKNLRRKHTLYQKDYLRAIEEKYSQAVRSYSDGLTQAYAELVVYMEGILKEFDDAVEAEPEEDNG